MRKRTPRQKDSLLSAIGPLVAFEGKIIEFPHALYTYFAMNLEKLPQTAMLATQLDQTR